MSQDNSQLARRSLGAILDTIGLASLIPGLAGLGSTAIAVQGASTTSKAVLDWVDKRISDSREARTKLILENLVRRLENVEARVFEEADVNLFVEVLSKAVSDDDERKHEFHSAVLDWHIRTRPSPQELRMLCSAVAFLSYEELRGFVDWMKRDPLGRPSGATILSIDALTSRLVTAGLLMQGSTTPPRLPTTLGRVLLERV